jgi:hypothetical protein
MSIGYWWESQKGSLILDVVLYGCESWFLTLRKEHGLRVFENRVLKGIFGKRRNIVIGDSRTLQAS